MTTATRPALSRLSAAPCWNRPQRTTVGFRTIIAGEGRSFGPGHIHNLANVRIGTALSVHVYAPRLATAERYAITPTGLKSKAVEQAGVDW
jgi:hypothetical protein